MRHGAAMGSAYFPTGTEIQLGLVPYARGTGSPSAKGGGSHIYLFIYLFKLEAPSPHPWSSGIDCEVLILVRVPEDGE